MKNMTDIEIMEAVRNRVANGDTYICIAINRVTGTNSRNKHPLRLWVESMLNGNYTLETWLEENDRLGDARSVDRCKELRLMWIDWMITELRAAP